MCCNSLIITRLKILGLSWKESKSQANRYMASLGLEAKAKAASDELLRMKSLLEKMMALKEELPTGYWIYDKVKGARRVTLARLVGVGWYI